MSVAGKTLRVLAVASSVTLLAGYVVYSQIESQPVAGEWRPSVVVHGTKALPKPVFDTRALKGVIYPLFRPTPVQMMSSSKSGLVRLQSFQMFEWVRFGVSLDPFGSAGYRSPPLPADFDPPHLIVPKP